MSRFSIAVTNIGGIDELSYEFDDEVLLVSGPNTTNKTSFLQSVAFGLGHSHAPIRSGADSAAVTLTIEEQVAERYAERTTHGIQTHGTSYIDDDEAISMLENFACLLEFNPLRVAVRNGDPFEPLLKEPIDIDALKREQQQKIAEKRSITQQLASLENTESELAESRSALETTRERIRTLQTAVDELREAYTEPDTEPTELESLREERASLTSQRNQYEQQVSDLENAIERLQTRRTELTDQIEATRDDAESTNIDQLKQKRETLQSELEQFEDRVDIIRSVYTANREMMSSSYTGVLGQESDVLEDTVTCWSCGTKTEVEGLEETLEELQSLIAADQQKLREYKPQLEELEDEIAAEREVKRAIRNLNGELSDIERQLMNRRESLETKKEQLERVEDEIETYTEEIETLEAESASSASDVSDRFEEKRLELHTAERERDRLEKRIETLEEQVAERTSLEEKRDQLNEDISSLTERIDGLEDELRSSFNDSMDELLDVLEFTRIERVWLTGDFDLVIAREVDGSIQRDTVENLSESEREMIGLILALSGFLTYDVAETVPVLLLDTLGAFDAVRTERLLEYFNERVDFVLTAVLPELAANLSYPTMDPEVRTVPSP